MKIFTTLIIIDVLAVFSICCVYAVLHRFRTARFKMQADDRLLYIQILIEMVYVYQHNPTLLLDRLREEMSIRKILNHHIIEDNCPKEFTPELKCQKKDLLLYLLHREGFSPRELCVIFGLNNLNSVYVKYHRINQKLGKTRKKKDDPDVVYDDRVLDQ